MTKQLWEKERNQMFWDLVREYKEDGYDKKDLADKLFNDALKDLN